MSSGGPAGGNEFYHRTAVGAADALGAQAPARCGRRRPPGDPGAWLGEGSPPLLRLE